MDHDRLFKELLTVFFTERLDELPVDKLDELGEALLDFASVADLEAWLSQH